MAARTCSGCGRSGPVELEMTLKAGQRLTMVSCTRCETRTWLADGAPVPMAEVLKLTSGDPDFEVTPSVKAQRRVARS